MKQRLQDAADSHRANGFADSTATRRGTEAALRVASRFSPEAPPTAAPLDWAALEDHIRSAARAAACLHLIESRRAASATAGTVRFAADAAFDASEPAG